MLDWVFYQDLLKLDDRDLYFVFDDRDLRKKWMIKKDFSLYKPSLIALTDCVNGSSLVENALIISDCDWDWRISSSFLGNSRIASINGCCCFDKLSTACWSGWVRVEISLPISAEKKRIFD